MRKHGWRTPEWKLIVALEPDFHGKPEIELYNLVTDPDENVNLAEEEPGVVGMLRIRMDAWIAKREAETGLTNPIFTNLQWHGTSHEGPFPVRKRPTTPSTSGRRRRLGNCRRGTPWKTKRPPAASRK